MEPSRAEVTRDLLCDAVTRLMATRSVSGMPVRDIAKEAGVAHGLVHRHFASKDALIREAAARYAARFHAEGTEPWQTSRFLDRLQESPEIATIIARCCLDGPQDVLELASPPPAAREEHTQRLRAALERAGLSVDPQTVVGLGCAALLGWIVFRPFLEATGYLGPNADADVRTITSLLDGLAPAPR